MPTPYRYKVPVTLPIGEVTVDADFCPGHPGNYIYPPEEDEVIVHQIWDESGVEMVLSDREMEGYHPRFEEAVGFAHSNFMSVEWDRVAQEWKAERDWRELLKSIPF